MKTLIEYGGGTSYQIDLDKPLDISIPLRGDAQNVLAWGLEPPNITPHRDGNFVGSVSLGSPVNFNDVRFNPHAHGTHTECVGHITEEFHSINRSLDRFFFLAELISVTPVLKNGDWVITKNILEAAVKSLPQVPVASTSQSDETTMASQTALVLRTRPNDRKKLSRQYSSTNPPYLLEEAARFLVDIGVRHVLIDLPSVDKEQDGGQLSAHKAFWNFDGPLRRQATITELIYVPDGIEDGLYFLNLQVAAFENDASPSRPVLYKIES